MNAAEANDDGAPWDLDAIKEDDFEELVVYIVPDCPVMTGCDNKAKATLPRNLVLKSSQALSDVSTHMHSPHNQPRNLGVNSPQDDSEDVSINMLFPHTTHYRIMITVCKETIQ